MHAVGSVFIAFPGAVPSMAGWVADIVLTLPGGLRGRPTCLMGFRRLWSCTLHGPTQPVSSPSAEFGSNICQPAAYTANRCIWALATCTAADAGGGVVGHQVKGQTRWLQPSSGCGTRCQGTALTGIGDAFAAVAVAVDAVCSAQGGMLTAPAAVAFLVGCLRRAEGPDRTARGLASDTREFRTSFTISFTLH